MIYHVKNNEYYPVKVTPLQSWEVDLHMRNWEENFNWSEFFYAETNTKVYKLTVSGDDTIQGAIALEVKEDHVFVHLVESAPHNRFGKVFDLVGEHLFAFACKMSFETGHEGFVAFQSKTKLVSYYENHIHAVHIGGGNMFINDNVAQKLIMLYLS